MALLNPVVSKFTIAAGTIQEVYVCPENKTVGLIDISFFKNDLSGTSIIAIALTTESNPANLTTVDYFIDNIKLINNVNVAEINKIIVGKGERLYVKVLSGPNVNVRVSGVEENNPKIAKAGRLAAAKISNTTQTQIFANNLNNISYISASITIFNTSTNNAIIECWISTNNTPSDIDKVLKVEISPQNTTILDNVFISPNEKVFVQSNQNNIEYFINGIFISS